MKQIMDFIASLADNAHFGKLITDVGPGLFLAIAALMLAANSGRFEFLPNEPKTEICREHNAKVRMVEELLIAYKDPASDEDRVSDNSIDQCPQDDESNDHSGNSVKNEEELLNSDFSQFQIFLDQRKAIAEKKLAAIKEETTKVMEDPRRFDVNDLRERREREEEILAAADAHIQFLKVESEAIKALREKYIKSKSILHNLDVMQEHVIKLLLLAVLLGVINSQIARLIIFRTYGKWLDKKNPQFAAARTNRAQLIVIGDNPRTKMLQQYFRYAESAINMAIPVSALGWAIKLYANVDLAEWVGMIIAGLLVWSGCSTYRSFRMKEFDLIQVGDIDVKLKGV